MNLKSPRQLPVKAAAGCLVAGLGLSVVNAESLMLDFGQTPVAAPYLTLSPAHNSGAISATHTTWNTIATSLVHSSLSYANNTAATGVTLTLGQEASAGNNVIDFGTAISNVGLAGTGGNVTGQMNMLTPGSIYGDDTSSTAAGRDGFFGGAGSAIGLRLDGLAAGEYQIYVMARNVNSSAASVPMNIYGATGASAGTFDFSAVLGLQQSNIGYATGDYDGQYGSFVNGENYVSLSLSLQEGQSIFLAVDGQPAGELRGFLNAVQVVQVPEPGTAAVFAMGLGAFAFIWRKRQAV